MYQYLGNYKLAILYYKLPMNDINASHKLIHYGLGECLTATGNKFESFTKPRIKV
jgi:hypothetical protein